MEEEEEISGSENGENPEVPAEQPSGKPKRKRSFGRFVWRTVRLLFLVAIVLAVSVVILSQTRWFRTKALGLVLELVNSNLTGRVEIKDLSFIPFKGFYIEGIGVFSAEDTVLTADYIIIETDFLKLTSNKAIIRKLDIHNPNIKLIRSLSDSSWNFEKIAPPSEDTTTSPTPDWLIDVRSLKLNGGRFRLIDSTGYTGKAETLIFSNLDLKNLNIDLNAKVALKEMSISAAINNISLYEANTGLYIKSLKTKAIVNKYGAKIEGFQISSPYLEAKLDASLDSIDILGGRGSIEQDAVFKVKLDAWHFDPKFINYFAVLGGLLGGKHEVIVDAEGKLNDIKLNQIGLLTGNTEIRFNGTVRNVLNIENFIYDCQFEKTKVILDDIKRALPGVDLSAVPEFKHAEMKGRVIGTIGTVKTDMALVTGIGSIKGTARVDYSSKELVYACDVDVKQLNLSPLARNEELRSNLNGHIFVDARGTNVQTMLFTLKTDLEDSFFRRSYIQRGKIYMAVTNPGEFKIDTLDVLLYNQTEKDSLMMNESNSSRFSLSGLFNIADMGHPFYDLKAEFTGIDLSYILEDKSYPSHISGLLTLAGSGFDLDSLEGSYKLDVYETQFNDRYLLPFLVDISASRDKTAGRHEMTIASSFADLKLEGEFNYHDLIPVIINQGQYLGLYINTQLRSINPDGVRPISNPAFLKKIGKFPDIHFKLIGTIKDISLIKIFEPEVDIFVSSELDIALNSSNDSSSMVLNKLNISNFNLNYKGNKVISNPITSTGKLDFTIKDSLPELKDLEFDMKADGIMTFNDLKLNYPDTYINFSADKADLSVSTGLNDVLKFKGVGKALFEDKRIALDLDSLDISIIDKFRWKNGGHFLAEYGAEGIKLTDANLVGVWGDSISIKGILNRDTVRNGSVVLRHFPLDSLEFMLNEDIKAQLGKISGRVDSISIEASGLLSNLALESDMKVKKISVGGSILGDIRANLSHKDSVITGELFVENPQSLKNFNVMQAKIESLPFNLSITVPGDRYHKAAPVNITLTASEFPLVVADPFIPGIDQLTGDGFVNLNFFGNAGEELQYKGEMSFSGVRLHVESTGLIYYAEGKMTLTTGNVDINNIRLYNSPGDLPGAFLDVTGTATLDGLSITGFDIYANTSQFMVLSNASERYMPDLFGTFVIASGTRPIHFSGSFELPNLDGDVSIIKADIKMPERADSKVSRSALVYEIKDRHITVKEVAIPDSSGKVVNEQHKNGKKVQQKDLADLINYDLYVKFAGPFVVTMNVNGSQLVAQIGVEDRTVPIRYVKNRDAAEAKLYGDIVVKQGSTLKLYKILTTKGKISFPTGDMSNPGLDLLAEYSGKTQIQGNNKVYQVRVKLTGTKNKPIMSFSYFIDGNEQVGDTATVAEEAIFLLVTGKKKDELFKSGGDNNLIGETLTSYISTETSKALTDLFQGTSFIQNADIEFSSNDWSSTRIKFSGTIAEDITWEVGGNVADFASENTFTIDIPLGSFLEVRNLEMNFQMSMSTNLSTQTSYSQTDWEVKFKVGKRW